MLQRVAAADLASTVEAPAQKEGGRRGRASEQASAEAARGV